MATASKHGDVVHDPKSLNIPECGNVVLNAWEFIYTFQELGLAPLDRIF